MKADNFGETKAITRIINEAFSLPLENDNDNLDPIFCLSCNTLWRECCLQVKRWLCQNDSSSSVSEELSNVLLEGWMKLVHATERIHCAVSKAGELHALIVGVEQEGGAQEIEENQRAALEPGLNVEDLFARFTVRWVEMQYHRFKEEVVPRMLANAQWQPIDFSQPESRYDQTAKDLLYFVDTCQHSFDQIPGHTKYPNIVRYGQHLLCDVLTFYADQIVEDFHQVVVNMVQTKQGRPVFGALFGLAASDSVTGDQKTLLIHHGAPLAVHVNTILHLQNMMMTLLENLNALEGVEGFMQESDEEEEEEEDTAATTTNADGSMQFGTTEATQLMARHTADGGNNWGDDLDDEAAVFNNLEV